MKKQTYLRVHMSDGSRWDIPACVIADSRARYYAKIDTDQSSGPIFDDAYKTEFDYTMKCDEELIEWAANNMNWSDVSINAKEVPKDPPKRPNYAEEWSNSKMEVLIH